MAGRSAVDDPLKVFRFLVQIDGFTRAGFTEVTGLQSTTDNTEYREGGDNSTPRQSVGLTKFDPIVLKRGQFFGSTTGGDDDAIAWYRQVFQMNSLGQSMIIRREIDIVQYHRDRSEARRWRVFEAWPKRYKPAADFNANSSDDSLEELEIMHEGWDLV